MTLYVIAGHGAGDPGSPGGGYNEADLTRKLAWAMGTIPGCQELDTSRNWYADGGISRIDFMKPGDFLIELHLDSFDGSAKGGHVIICDQFEPDAYDQKIASFLKSYFPGRSDMIVKRGDLANPNRAAAKGINYRMVEVCFIDNASDRNKFLANVPYIAEQLCACFGLKKAEPKQEAKAEPAKEPEPTPEPEPEANTEPTAEAKQDTEPPVELEEEQRNAIARLLAATILPFLEGLGIATDVNTLALVIGGIFALGTIWYAWWRNNNMTKAAVEGQKVTDKIKALNEAA